MDLLEPASVVSSVFTFHYVSINIGTAATIAQAALVFTFHYVSINIQIPNLISLLLRSLHSTMYLLISTTKSEAD